MATPAAHEDDHRQSPSHSAGGAHDRCHEHGHGHDGYRAGLPRGTVEADDATTPAAAHTHQATGAARRSTPSRSAGAAAGDARTGLRQVLAPLALPLFFVIMMSVAYVSALHAPAPHDAPLVVAGPEQVVTQVATGLQQAAPGAFQVTTTTDAATARQAVAQHEAIGAVVVGAGADGATRVTSYVASGGGQAQVRTVDRVASQVAAQLGASTTTEDVAPSGAEDPTGTGLFYLLVVCAIAGYLTVTVLAQAVPDLALRSTYLVVTGAAVVAPLLSMLLMSLFVGGYGASSARLAATYGVAVLYTLTVGALAVLITQLLGRAAIFGLMLVMVFINLPSAGGGVPAAMLPSSWQHVHAVWFGAAGMEAFRSIIYFDGAGLGRWLLQLSTWTVVGLVASLALGRAVVHRRRTGEASTCTSTGASADTSAGPLAATAGAGVVD